MDSPCPYRKPTLSFDFRSQSHPLVPTWEHHSNHLSSLTPIIKSPLPIVPSCCYFQKEHSALKNKKQTSKKTPRKPLTLLSSVIALFFCSPYREFLKTVTLPDSYLFCPVLSAAPTPPDLTTPPNADPMVASVVKFSDVLSTYDTVDNSLLKILSSLDFFNVTFIPHYCSFFSLFSELS